jgi:hypothetical protein
MSALKGWIPERNSVKRHDFIVEDLYRFIGRTDNVVDSKNACFALFASHTDVSLLVT